MNIRSAGGSLVWAWAIASILLASEVPITAPPEELSQEGFYSKFISAEGYPILASQQVNDYALREAAYLVNRMLAHRPDVREALIQGGSRLVVMAHDQYTTDIPDHAHLRPRDFWDRRARGLGGSATDPACSCGEENLLGYRGDPYARENILIHEFAHMMHLRGLNVVDPTFDRRLQAAYRAAREAGLWEDTYAATNHHEYWAEGVQSWFSCNAPPDHQHNEINSAEQIRDYDPKLAALCEEVFGPEVYVYTRPETRLEAHLAGYDPASAPRFRWPERLASTRDTARRGSRSRPRAEVSEDAANQTTVAEREHEIQQIEGWTVHVDRQLLDESHRAVGEPALKLLAYKLFEISLVVPPCRLEHLREVPIWIDRDHSLGSLQYHVSADWLRNNGHDPAMARAVHIPRAQRLIDLTVRNTQPWVMLHELAHAYHHRVLGYDDPAINAAYERAVASGLYESVLHINGRQVRHYALTNAREFFAELTEAYFGTNDFYPFVRAELQEYDPETYALLEEIWRADTRTSEPR